MSSREAETKAHSERVIAGVPGRARRARARAAYRRSRPCIGTGHASARRARRPPPRCARATALALLRAAGARHLHSRPGTRCPTTASAPTPTSWPTRIAALATADAAARARHPTVVLTTVNAILQRVPPRAFIRAAAQDRSRRASASTWTELTQRLGLVRLPAHRHGHGAGRISRCAAASSISSRRARATPVRLDFFGDTLETIKAFDPQTQRTTKPVQKLALLPISEVAFGDEAEKRFRTPLRRAVRRRDRRRSALRGRQRRAALSRARSTGCRCSTTSWRRCSTICRASPVSFDHLAEEAVTRPLRADRRALRRARSRSLEAQSFGAPPYKPVPPERMYLDDEAWAGRARKRTTSSELTPFEEVEGRDVRSWRAGEPAAASPPNAQQARRERLRRGRRTM